MKILISIATTLLLSSCINKTTTSVYIFNNTTNHTIDLIFYESLVHKEIKTYTTLKINPKSANNSLISIGKGGHDHIINTYDSVLVTYDGTIKTIHISNFGKPSEPDSNRILDYSSWISIPNTADQKKERKIEYIYTFTEEDYLKAL